MAVQKILNAVKMKRNQLHGIFACANLDSRKDLVHTAQNSSRTEVPKLSYLMGPEPVADENDE